MASLPAALLRVVSREAIAFLAKLAVEVKPDTPEQLALEGMASQEFIDANERARIMVTDKAISLIQAVKKAVETGDIPQAWDRNDRMQQLVTTGLKQYDPRIAFQATLRSAYSAGRYERGMEDTDEEEYWLYRTMRDARVRDSHAILDGVYLPKAHPFWSGEHAHFPPNGWRCRCKGVSMSQAGIDRLTNAGLKLKAEAPKERLVTYKDKLTGQEFKLPESIEPGWNLNPGTEAGRAALRDMLTYRMGKLRAEAAST